MLFFSFSLAAAAAALDAALVDDDDDVPDDEAFAALELADFVAGVVVVVLLGDGVAGD